MYRPNPESTTSRSVSPRNTSLDHHSRSSSLKPLDPTRLKSTVPESSTTKSKKEFRPSSTSIADRLDPVRSPSNYHHPMVSRSASKSETGETECTPFHTSRQRRTPS
uniref:(northern house mosquito) hypothetical protein n=1 Tax=Culex pipiens TaxID=7175 RepID=A0A8D8JVU7_CULPI